MNSREFIAGVLKTKSPRCIFLDPDLEHATTGLASEVGEFAGHIKDAKYQGKPLDPVNLREELGDILWYAALACHALGTNFEELMALNQAKLKLRYGDKFTVEGSLNRDLDAEREALSADTVRRLEEML